MSIKRTQLTRLPGFEVALAADPLRLGHKFDQRESRMPWPKQNGR